MALYKITIISSGEVINLRVVKNMAFGGEQTNIIYESPGSNGGLLLSTGRKNKKLNLSGVITSKLTNPDDILQDLSDYIETIADIRDDGEVIKMTTPIAQNDTGFYVIKSFTGVLNEGAMFVDFNLELDEYRQKGVKQAAINLVNFQPTESLKEAQTLREQL